MTNHLRLILFISILLFPNSLYAGEAGLTGATTLTRAGGARPSGLGETFAAVSGDLQSVYYNPAGLATLAHPQLTASYLRGFADDSFGSINYGHNVPFGTFFIGGIYFDAGDIDLNLSSGLRETRKAQEDIVGTVGLALGRNFPIQVGVLGKSYKFELAEEAKTDGFAFDSGVIVKTPLKWLQVGGSVQNIGSDVKFEQTGDPLPTTVRYGLAFETNFENSRIDFLQPYSFLLIADQVKVKEEDSSTHTGFELNRKFLISDRLGQVSLRGGYISEPEVVTVGIGVLVSLVRIDYALNFLDEALDNTHRVTLGFIFGSSERKNRSKRPGKRPTLAY